MNQLTWGNETKCNDLWCNLEKTDITFNQGPDFIINAGQGSEVVFVYEPSFYGYPINQTN